MDITQSLYRGFCFPAEIISHTVFLYYRFPLSLRDVEELLMLRGIVVSIDSEFLKGYYDVGYSPGVFQRRLLPVPRGTSRQ